MKKQIVIFVVILLVSMAGSFFLGAAYSNSKTKNSFPGSIQSGMLGSGYGFNRGSTNGKNGINIANGEVLSKDDSSITLKDRNGGSKIILFSSSTTILKSTEGVIDDVKTGDSITVTGKTNSDGSVTAESIQIRDQIIPQQNQEPVEQPQNNNK